MKIMRLGLDLHGRALFDAIEEAELAERLMSSLARTGPQIKSLTASTSALETFRSEVRRVGIDPGDPKSVGWNCVLNAATPKLEEILTSLAPLAELRGVAAPWKPILFDGGPPDSWMGWLDDNYRAIALEGRKRPPQYLLIVGNPDLVPFRFQALLGTVANVGRLDFDDLDDLRRYVDKVVRLETAPEPVTDRSVVFFAPDGGAEDPTHYSCEMMVKPLASHVSENLGMKVTARFGAEATRRGFESALRGARPAIVYTASHGLGAVDESLEVQKRLNGAICCQARALTRDALFAADDVPMDEPFLEGAIFFQFACFGYGTPAQSDYEHWLGNASRKLADADFVAALPKRLLAHPRGPIAYIGHVDTAFLHAFVDPERLNPLDRWGNRMGPFKSALDRLLETDPPGLAMDDMSMHYASSNSMITYVYDEIQRGGFQWTPEKSQKFLDQWIVRSDAQNYFVLGDPGVRVRIPGP